jgi:protein arginine N-methyltransferase 5
MRNRSKFSLLVVNLTNSHNNRSALLNFHIKYNGVLHGLAGYFEAVLYGDIGISIHPERMDKISPNMTSWFPLLFPIKVCRQQFLFII